MTVLRVETDPIQSSQAEGQSVPPEMECLSEHTAATTTGGESSRAPTSDALTPAMRQYQEQKQRVGDAILLFRMGDFYETFYEDAMLCAKVLGIALTTRDRNSPNPVPLAGIPYHALDTYLAKLVQAGYRVAISEQLEDPKQAKGVVRRDVVRIVSAGTLTDEKLLSGSEDNLLAAVCLDQDVCGIAIAELAGGRLEVLEASKEEVLDELVRLRPAEILASDEMSSEDRKLAVKVGDACLTAVTLRPAPDFESYAAQRTLLGHFGVSTLLGFGFEEVTAGVRAAGALLRYLQETQRTALPHIQAVKRLCAGDFLPIDQNTWRALEIDRTLRGNDVRGTLWHAIDRTVHPHGARLLRQWLRRPLTEEGAIRLRQEAVGELVEDDVVRRGLRASLKQLADIERIASRVALARCSPRDLDGLRQALAGLPTIRDQLRGVASRLLQESAAELDGFEKLHLLLQSAIQPNPPVNLHEGGFIAEGFHSELDRLRRIGWEGQRWLGEYQRQEAGRTGIASLKVGYNRVFGYYIEVPNSARDRVPPEYVRKQTVKNAERYVTQQLKEHEQEVLTAAERANQLEFDLFQQVRDQVAGEVARLLRCAAAIARLDCLAGLAELAVQRRYVRPIPCDEPCLEIRDGRHPVLDQTLGDALVPNDLTLDAKATVHVVTGPNMAGKSTFIRQAALLTLLAQIGSYVPAGSMRWGLVDRIFARVGSADEIARGQSTFMTEMIDAANILHHATNRSLVILDELGRGTSTFDGLSLAWAITEHLASRIGCRTLVATHYHELTELAASQPNVRNFNVAVVEQMNGPHEDVVFLHRIVPGGANKSYGIHVARLAGVPAAVIERSRQVLLELQKGFGAKSDRGLHRRGKSSQLSLFADPGAELLTELEGLDLKTLSEAKALEVLHAWKARFGLRAPGG